MRLARKTSLGLKPFRITSVLCRQFFSGLFSSSHDVLSDIQRQGSDLPTFSRWTPHNVVSAASNFSGKQALALQSFEEKLKKISSVCDKLSSGEASELLSETIAEWDKMSATHQELINSTRLLCLLSVLATKKKWKQSYGEVRSKLPLIDENKSLGDQLQPILTKLLDHFDSSHNRDCVWAANQLLQDIRRVSGSGLQEKKAIEYRENLMTIQSVECRILETSSNPDPKEARQFISDAYSVLEKRARNSEILGYPSFAHMVLSRRTASEQDLHNLHEAVANKFVPLVADGIDIETFDLKYLERTGMVSPTLDGCLAAVAETMYELFGVEIREDRDSKNVFWHGEIRLFHVFDTEEYDEEGAPKCLGSIVVDPFRRPGKIQRSFVLPIRPRGTNILPFAGMSLDLIPPTWNDNSPQISWDNAEDIFHEWGHAVQILFSRQTLGAVCGAQNLSLDLSEISPKVMEHFLFEESALKSVIERSGTGAEFTSDMEDALLRRRSQRKILQTLQHIFLGSLELELFSSFDPKGEESMMSLQRRLAANYIPHDQPDHKDVSPLLEVLQENARGTHVAMYRYFWSDIYAAGIFGAFLDVDFNDKTSERIRLRDKETRQRLGRQLRRDFLEPGATVDFHANLKEFGGQSLGTADPLLNLFKLKNKPKTEAL